MTHHRRGLRRLLRDDDLAGRVERDWAGAGLSDRRVAMLTFALKLTLEPGSMTEDDVEPLRAAGFADLDILHIVEVTAYFAYVNRIADGLGVPLEDWIVED